MFYACISIKFRDGIPTFSTTEPSTVHVLDESVQRPRRAIKPGDVVIIKTAGFPMVKLVVNRFKSYNGQLGGAIVGKASFFESAQIKSQFADEDTVQGGLAPAT